MLSWNARGLLELRVLAGEEAFQTLASPSNRLKSGPLGAHVFFHFSILSPGLSRSAAKWLAAGGREALAPQIQIQEVSTKGGRC